MEGVEFTSPERLPEVMDVDCQSTMMTGALPMEFEFDEDNVDGYESDGSDGTAPEVQAKSIYDDQKSSLKSILKRRPQVSDSSSEESTGSPTPAPLGTRQPPEKNVAFFARPRTGEPVTETKKYIIGESMDFPVDSSSDSGESSSDDSVMALLRHEVDLASSEGTSGTGPADAPNENGSSLEEPLPAPTEGLPIANGEVPIADDADAVSHEEVSVMVAAVSPVAEVVGPADVEVASIKRSRPSPGTGPRHGSVRPAEKEEEVGKEPGADEAGEQLLREMEAAETARRAEEAKEAARSIQVKEQAGNEREPTRPAGASQITTRSTRSSTRAPKTKGGEATNPEPSRRKSARIASQR
ncbi:hypothetical protein MMC29_003947 [Sticta canariensis]|nr:hypothetical protein [Sticta canariensis]